MINRQLIGVRTTRRAKDSEWTSWQQPVKMPKRYTLFCCDCGLAHQFHFRVHKDRAQFRVRRADSYTQAHRKQKVAKREIELLKKGERVKALIDNVMVITLTNGLRRGGARKQRRK